MWFIAEAWARGSGGHGGVQHHGSGDYYPSDSETGLALIVGAILIWIGWSLFEFFKTYHRKRGGPIARARTLGDGANSARRPPLSAQ